VSLIVVTGGKGSAGITTTATALAALWPQTAILADCDPFGGDLAMRLRRPDGRWLARDMGIVGLAAAARVDATTLDVSGQLQTAVGGLPVLVGVESAAQASRIGALWSPIARSLAAVPTTDVIADCGRLVPGAASEHLLALADAVILVTRPTAESVAHLRHALALLGGDSRHSACAVVVIASADTSARDVQEVGAALDGTSLTVSVLGTIAFDPPAAAGLAGEPTRSLDRSALVTTARQLAPILYDTVHRTNPVPSSETSSRPALVEAR
jgi:MinD-like ATPase involved in chromosome partitioning or flagellar assembly